MDGYVLTPGSAISYTAIAGVRYACKFTEGGLIATDALEHVYELGEVMRPYDPENLWWRFAAPKRAIGTGNEVFGLVSVDLLDTIEPMLSAAARVQLSPALASRFGVIDTDLALVETQGAKIPLAVWQGRVTDFSDARIAQAI